MQPRLLVIALAFFFFWAVAKFRFIQIVPFLAITLSLVSIAPGILIVRNYEVHGYAAISTNLRVTMRLGAGPEATGGYSNRAFGAVECPETRGDASEIDNAIVGCVVDWYLENPTKALALFWNKARFFWSPRFGPESNGTMARNPWNQNHPLKSTAQTQDGFNLIFGGFGKFISWIWMLGGLILLYYGFVLLWRLGGLERLIALVAASTFLINLLSSMLTIGDHRFRIPSMGLSIFAQVIGLVGLYSRKSFAKSTLVNLVIWPVFKPKQPSQLGS